MRPPLHMHWRAWAVRPTREREGQRAWTGGLGAEPSSSLRQAIGMVRSANAKVPMALVGNKNDLRRRVRQSDAEQVQPSSLPHVLLPSNWLWLLREFRAERTLSWMKWLL